MPYKHNETSIQISKLEIWFSNHLFATHENKVIMISENYIRFRKKSIKRKVLKKITFRQLAERNMWMVLKYI